MHSGNTMFWYIYLPRTIKCHEEISQNMEVAMNSLLWKVKELFIEYAYC